MSPRKLVRDAFCVVAMFLMTDAVISVVSGQSDGNADLTNGNIAVQVAMSIVYAGTLLLFLGSWKKSAAAIRSSSAVLVFVLFVLASVFWSSNPWIVARRAVALVGTTMFAWYLVGTYSPADMVRLIAYALALGVLGSVLFAVLLPGVGVHGPGDKYPGAWRGVYQQKNLLGRWMAMSFYAFWTIRIGRRRAWLAMAGLAVACVLLSTSVTGLALTLLALLIRPLSRCLRLRGTWAPAVAIAAVTVCGICAALVATNAGALLPMIGRDATLTGRSGLWAAASARGIHHFWLGVGFRGFWLGRSGESAKVWSEVGWTPASGHNSFVDAWLELGAVGASGLCLLLLRDVLRSIRRLRRSPNWLAEWRLGCLLLTVVVSVSNTVIPAPNSLFWVLVVVIHASLASRPEASDPRALASENETLSGQDWELT